MRDLGPGTILSAPGTAPDAARSWPRAIAAVLLLFAGLAMPHAPGWSWASLLIVPAELPVLILMLAWLGRGARWLATAILWCLIVQKSSDLAVGHILGRSFNVMADLPLARAAWDLLAGIGGPVAAAGTLAAIAVAATLVGIGLGWACGVLADRGARRPAVTMGLMLVPLAVLPLAFDAGVAGNVAYAALRVQQARQTLADRQDLRTAMARDPFANAQGLLDIIDRDMLVIFVESYGRTSFDTPFYAERHRATLRRAEARLADAGLAMRSGFVTAPTQGGQSWLSHATLASGLWIADQSRYRALLTHARDGLFHHARRSGFRTAAVMPAITRPWPEAAGMGFDTVLAAANLGYRGKPFNWVTMPDQFTLAAADRLLRSDRDAPRLFAQVALISSHAPWVPVPRLLDWTSLGDGRVFDAMAVAGDPPEVVWRDRDRVRDAYRDAVDYSLATVMDYALRHADDPPLLIVLGDHQAAPSIALDDRPDTALHVIGPAHLVDRTAAWGLGCGLLPAGGDALPMDRLRDLMLGTFSSDPPRHRTVRTPGPGC